MKNPRRPEHGIEIVTQKMNADSYYRRRFRAQDFVERRRQGKLDER